MRKTVSLPLLLLTFGLVGAAVSVGWLLLEPLLASVPLDDVVELARSRPDMLTQIGLSGAMTWALAGMIVLTILPPNATPRVTMGLAVAFGVIALAPPLLHGLPVAALADDPIDLIAGAVEAVMVVMLARRLRNGVRWRVSAQAGHRAAPNAGGADQVTRLLCGHAVLGGERFRSKLLGAFEDNARALAPEFGFDIEKVVTVAAAERARVRRHFAKLGVLGALMMAAFWVLPMLAILPAIFAVLVQAGHEFETRRRAKSLRHGAFKPETVAATFQGDLEPGTVLPRADDDLVIYSGFSPFVGAGVGLGGWSFAALVDKPKLPGAPSTVRPFTMTALYDALRHAVLGLGIPELTCRLVYFSNGVDVRDDPDIIGTDVANRPRQRLPAARAAQVANGSDKRIRAYLCIQVTDWGGELVYTVYVRGEQRGRTLFLETAKFLLPAIATKYRSIDRLMPDRWQTDLVLLAKSLLVGPLASVPCVFLLLGRAADALTDEERARLTVVRARRKRIVHDAAYDFGAGRSLREEFARPFFQSYFQKSDVDQYAALIERRVLEELSDFLGELGVDTADLRERTNAILNADRLSLASSGPGADLTPGARRSPRFRSLLRSRF